MIVIVPCCGESQRFNGVKKQFLKLPNGLPLPIFSASGITDANRKIYTFIETDFIEHMWNVTWGGALCLLKQKTQSQVETIRQTIIKEELYKRSIYIKDCDNFFEASALPNTVTVQNIQNANFKLHNKSYTAHKDGLLIRIAERTQISQYVNVGGYGFASGEFFLKYSEGKSYISQVITEATQHTGFRVNFCKNYIDYGEQEDYDNFLKNRV